MTELQLLNIIITALLAMLGACVASFINVAALRKAEGLSFITGRSHCPACGKTLRWYELIPIFSWLLLAGRCRACKLKISPRYLLVELIGALAAALGFVRYGPALMTALVFAVSVLLLAVALIDLSTMEIPNGLVIAFIPFAAAAIWVQPEVPLLARGIGFLVGSVPMLFIALVIDGAFGGGDVKLMAICGILLGWQNTVLALFAAVVTAGIVSLKLILQKKAKKGAHIAFGPHLCVGTMIALLYGTEIITWYLSLSGL